MATPTRRDAETSASSRTPDERFAFERAQDALFEPVDAGHIPYLAHPERCAELVRDGR